MEKSQVDKYPQGTPEYVVLHARWQMSRGRKPSASYCHIKNPRKALYFAGNKAYFSPLGEYLKGVALPDYKCSSCGATGSKMWLRLQKKMHELVCTTCALKKTKKNYTLDDQGYYLDEDDTKNDLIALWYGPAVPTEDGKTYWGYTSIPVPGRSWWEKLPTYGQPATETTTQ